MQIRTLVRLAIDLKATCRPTRKKNKLNHGMVMGMYENSLDELIFARRGMGFIQLTHLGDVQYSSKLARNLLAQHGISLVSGRISIVDQTFEENERKLEAAIAACLASDPGGETWVTLGEIAKGGVVGSFVRSRSSAVEENVIAAMFRKAFWEQSTEDELRLAAVYGLTTREAQLAVHLGGAREISEFATERSLAMNTVKSHLQQLFRKLGVRRQIEVAVLVLAALR